MLGHTTSQKGSKIKGEKLNLTLKTNQLDHSILEGTTFTISYGTYSKTYTWEGISLLIEIPGYTEYTITFGDVPDYSTPRSIIDIAVSGNSRIINAVYNTEVVSVTVNAINGESMVGQIVTVNGTEHTWNGTAITQKVPFDTTYEVSVNDREDYITPESQSFTANQAKRSVFMQYVDIPVTDLSKVDIYGNPVAQNTANCYVIKEAGKYMFPIAYGAAIKNGAVNAEAYTKNSGTNSHDFVNYNGNIITSPYVETDTATQASSVQISIADMDNAVTDLEIVEGDGCRYVKFEVSEVPAVGANAVISVKDSSGVIMWNWHLWLWEDDLAVEEITNFTNVKYKILPYNLGSKWDDTAKTKIKNWFYQFGRPVPLLCPSAYNSLNNHASVGALSFTTAAAASNLYNSIQSPTTFYNHEDSYYNWFKSNSDKIYNLWDAGCTTTGNSDNDVIKTVYDPCPVGFKMPNGNTFTNFYINNVIGNFANGWKFKRYSGDTVGVFFPASGRRKNLDGSLYGVGSYGNVWLSSFKLPYYAYALNFVSSYATPQGNGYYASGFSVRPVQDSALDLPTHKLTISVTGDSSIPSGYEVKVYSVTKTTDETTGEVTETLGDVLATQTTDSATHELIWGTEYKIVASDVNGFITPESLGYVADVENRDVSLVYVAHAGTTNPTNGVYIQDTDGFFHTEAEWDGTYTADCIAVITDSCRFGISLPETSNMLLIHSSYDGALENYMTAIPNETQAKADYNGAANTTNIMKLQPSTDYAAGWCNAFSFPSGKKGFLPSLGQMWTAYNNKAAVDAALTKVGGTVFLSSSRYWTSTFHGVGSGGFRGCWHLNLSDGSVSVSGAALIYGFYVRAFCSI